MNLDELITFCTLKGRVRVHKRLKIRSKVKPGFRVYKLELQARGYNAYIRYVNDNGKLSIAHTTLFDYSKPNQLYQENVSLKLIEESILGT